MNKRSRNLALAVVVALGLVACDRSTNPPTSGAKEAATPPVATVNGKPIAAQSFDMWVEGVTQRKAAELEPEQRKKALEALVAIYVAADEAEKQGLARDPETAARIDLDRRQALANALIQSKMKANEPTEETLKTEYDKLVADGTLAERKVRHILVAKEDLAKSLITQLEAGGSFEALAKKHSTDGGSKGQGGDLGWLGGPALGQMVPEFTAAVRQLGKGEITKAPVQSQFGYHVIQVEDTRAVPMEAIKEQLSRMVQQKQVSEYMEGLKKTAKIEEKLPPAPVAAAPAAGTPAPGTEPVPATGTEPAPAPAPASQQ